MKIIVAMTGASGAMYGVRFLARAAELGADVELLVTSAGTRVGREELGVELDPAKDGFRALLGEAGDRVTRVPTQDIGAACASGSVEYAGMAVIPCSMGTVARIAAGTSSNLVERAADVTLKERRPLVVVPRETPLNRVHLKNLLELHDAGGVVLPAMPSFYHRPDTVDELIDTVVDRALSFFFGPDAIRKPWSPAGGRS